MKKKILLISLCLALAIAFTACGSSNLEAVQRGLDLSQSPYAHITNGGQYVNTTEIPEDSDDGLPYDIDAITAATLTIEGPATQESVPLAVGTLESHTEIMVRGQYKDKSGVATYEGADLYQLITELESEKISLTDKAYKVVIKNSNRAEVASFTIENLKKASEAGRPVILAYGVGTKDGSTVAPFVFDGKTSGDHLLGYVSELKNDDGCLKLVCDSGYSEEKYSEFVNAAYVYIVEESEPGYKHTDSSDSSYSSEELTNYIVAVRGDVLGYELDFTTEQLEALVQYDKDGNVAEDGIGYRRAYSLANNSYWYVNEYEGLKLYEFLMYCGMPSYEEMGTKAARSTLIKFLASDGVTSSQSFSVDALSYPDAFGFYNKNAADHNDGTYVPTNEDLVETGYPVLLAYGFNNYPYVISKKDAGYLSGLSNSGGPFRVIFGKMNYSHTNGSNQVQALSDIIVGNDVNYNTHKYTDVEALTALADTPLALSLSVNGTVYEQEGFSVGSLEDVLYGNKVTANAKKAAQVKKSIDGNIYEGVDLAYLVSDTLNLPYYNDTEKVSGSVVISTASGDVTIALSDIESGKYVLAFAKNGTPLVASEGSDGYVKERSLRQIASTDPAVYSVDNAGGPVELIIIGEDTEYKTDVTSVKVVAETKGESLEELRKLAEEEAERLENAVPNEEIAWNHSMAAEYEALLDNTITVVIENDDTVWERVFTLREIEAYTDSVFRGKYSVMEIGWCEGLDIWKFIKEICGYDASVLGFVAKQSDVAVSASSPIEGLKSVEKVSVLAPDGYEVNLLDIFQMEGLERGVTADDGRSLPLLLCYGVKGYALVSRTIDDGYVEEADNAYGPLRLIAEKSSQSSVKNCSKIYVKIPGTGDLGLPE